MLHCGSEVRDDTPPALGQVNVEDALEFLSVTPVG
jgi:hypothetical protein